MPRLSRHARRRALAFITLPGLVAGALPLLLAWIALDVRSFSPVGLIALAPGLILLLWCVRTLAMSQERRGPLDPRRLLSVGPYRRTRNPMYLAVGLILAGWAIGFRSAVLAVYALAAMAALHLWLVRMEEPELARTYGTEWTRYSGHVPRWVFPSRMALVLAVIALLAAIPIAGLFYETYADAKAGRDFPAPGVRVDIGGRGLHLLCIGEGEPTVIFESGGTGAGSLASTEVRNGVARHTRVCSYDRAGTGWSDPAPAAMSSADLARDLAVLQDRAGLPAPLILVASSIGGLTVEMFARQFPERIAGLVFLDAATSGSLRDLSPTLGRARAAATAGSVAAHLGLIRLLDPFHIPADSEDGRRTAAMTYGSKAIDAFGVVVGGLPRSVQEFDDAPALPGDVRLVVLSASDPDTGDLPWPAHTLVALSHAPAASQQALAKASSRGSWSLVPDTNQPIATAQPEVVIEHVVSMIEATRGTTVGRVRRR